MNGSKPLLISLCAFTLAVSTGSVLANEVSGLSFEQNGKSTQLTVDVDTAKANGAKVEKKKNGTVVIHLPKSNLPKAYEQYGLPPIQDRKTGLSATVQKRGDGLEIVIPAASSQNLKIQLKSASGSTTSVGSTSSTPSVLSKTSATKAKPVTTVKTPPVVVTKPAAAKKVTTKTATALVKVPVKAPVKMSIVKPAASKPVIKIVSSKLPPQNTAKATMSPTATSAVTKPVIVKTATQPSASKIIVGPVIPLNKAAKTENDTTEKPLTTTLPVIEETAVKEKPVEKMAEKLPSLLTPTTNKISSFSTTVASQTDSGGLQKLMASPYVQWFFLICLVLGIGILVITGAVMFLLRSRKRQTALFQELPTAETVMHPEMMMQEAPLQQVEFAETMPPVQQQRSFEDHLTQQEAPKVTSTQPVVKKNPAMDNTTVPTSTDMRFAQLAQSRKKRF